MAGTGRRGGGGGGLGPAHIVERAWAVIGLSWVFSSSDALQH